LLDLTPTEASQVHQKVEGFKAKVLTPTESKRPNRRVYFLAVNQASDKRILAQADFRRALALGINREDLLDQYFRGGKTDLGLGKLHVALNGPYPAHSWACDPKVSKPKTSGRDTLDPFDPLGARAMAGLCAQLEANLGIAVTPVKKDPHALREDVEIKRTYDLAYYHYDFPDETYWLWPLLAPRAPTAAGNYLEFSGTDKLQQLLRDAKERRNFTVLRDRTLMIHKLLSEETPVVPLWQLDPLNAVNQDVKYEGGFDPLLVFPDVENWRLERTAR
jgi:ABC-type oligopeptide transport system substrate-binding subunit